jgi:hypothetical protein
MGHTELSICATWAAPTFWPLYWSPGCAQREHVWVIVLPFKKKNQDFTPGTLRGPTGWHL